MAHLRGIRLVSSNDRKLAEFAEMGLPMDMAVGVDLPEVDGTPDEVIVHKSVAAGAGTLVEDTILFIDGVPVVDVRWRLGELGNAEGASSTFIVSLALNDGESVSVWQGRVDGRIVSPGGVPQDSFGFDAFFVPDGSGGIDLHSLALCGRKHEFSARARAVRSLLERAPDLQFEITEVQPWSGSWQGGRQK